MAKVFITHPRTRKPNGELYKTGEQEVAQKVADSLIKRKLAKSLEVATPSKDDDQDDATKAEAEAKAAAEAKAKAEAEAKAKAAADKK